MSESIVTVPHQDKDACLAMHVLVRKGDWCIGQTARAGIAWDDPEEEGFCIAPSFGPKRLVWLGDDEWFGCHIGHLGEHEDLEAGLNNLQRFTAKSLMKSMRRRRGWSHGLPNLSDLRQMPAKEGNQ